MKNSVLLFVFAVSMVTARAYAAQTAQVKLFCTSVKLNQGLDEYGDKLSVNSDGTANGAGELIPWGQAAVRELEFPLPSYYTSVATLYDNYFYHQNFYTSSFFLYLPDLVDDDGNGMPDFFETARAIDTYGLNGSYDFNVYSGAMWTTWSRPAGSKNGTCVNEFHDDYVIDFGTFNNSFEILEYTGTLSYTPGATVVSGNLNLTQTGKPTSKITGPVRFAKSSSTPHEELTVQPGIITNVTSLSFTNHVFRHDTTHPTNYVGYIEFDNDGDQNTFYPYAFWVMVITDLNDANKNEIPDFSDDAQVIQPPRQPQLTLARDGDRLQLTIRGDVGHVHQVQQATSLNGSWQDATSVTLNTDPQVVTLTLPTATTFWRVQAQ